MKYWNVQSTPLNVTQDQDDQAESDHQRNPGEVYDALMDPKKHAAFTGDEASGSSEVGGEFIA
ncbi:MAG: hypothetical protein NT137_06155 [Methanomassiliicoccales archaeon]|nr:hypothetical protein [Methanomassiliicoccales archaeon]